MNPNNLFIQEAGRVIRENSIGKKYFVLYADINDFHSVNHHYGIEAGNALLIDVENFLNHCDAVRFCSRIFADFFLCLCCRDSGVRLDDMMKAYDQRLRNYLHSRQSRYPACHIKISCGVCPIEHDGADDGGITDDEIERAIDGANVARKLSKKQLTTKAILYNEQMQKQIDALQLAEQEIYNALREERFCFYLQPKVELTTGVIIGAEALVRRIGKDGIIIYPDNFLNIMEVSGSIVELDQMVCRLVCSFLSSRIQKDLPVVPISINLSRLHVQDPEAADRFHAIAQGYHIPPELLEFELTESILFYGFAEAKRLIDQLRAYGYRVSIDNFGTSSSGINIWQELTFDFLKLDHKLLSDSPELKARNEALVPNIINIAQRLHVQVLCEGVETEEQCLYLLNMGCTSVQGYIFSRPLPSDQFFDVYERQNGRYPLPPSLLTEKTDIGMDTETDVAGWSQVLSRIKPYLLVIPLCALFLGICITVLLSYNRVATHREFTHMVTETLNAYTNGQRESTLKEIDGVTSTLQSLAVLIKQENDPAFLNSHLTSLNEESEDVRYYYLSVGDYHQAIADGSLNDKDIKILDRLAQGETVVTDIVYSERLGDIYCIGIGVPVLRDGELMGAVRGVIDAATLVRTNLYDPSQGTIERAFLIDGDGTVLPVQPGSHTDSSVRLFDLLKENGLPDETIKQLQTSLSASDDGAVSVRLGTFNGCPYYMSMVGLKYNDWHLVVSLKADAANTHFQFIVRSTMYCNAGLIIAVLAASTVLIVFFKKTQRKSTLDEQRYLLLERFSDTVLFDYDCRRDVIHFTSNAADFLRLHNLKQNGFLYRLDQVYVYAGDRDAVRQMLSGQINAKSGKIRVRLLRPHQDEYFWCLAQFQYLYEKDTLVSVVGKITDIDEHMRHEDYLLKMSETDGLTGLFNKATVEKFIGLRLAQQQPGMLFVIDVDDFKQINDHYGHTAGDAALRYMGECLKRLFQNGGITGRIGGDEFIGFQPGPPDKDAVYKSIRQLEDCLRTGSHQGIVPLTASIGIACYPSDGSSYQELFQAADKAMYSAKQNGKMKLCFYADVHKHV